MPKIYMPSTGPEAWKRLLAKPDLHWKKGRSARAVAHAWEASKGLPPEIVTLLKSHPDFAGTEPELLVAFPEWKVPIPGGDRDSQSDVFSLVRCGSRSLAIAVEGKVSESFGPTVDQWLKDASDGKRERLSFLCETLGIDQNDIAALRYQLFHRTVSAILECDRFGMTASAMIVHSFSQTHQWLDDYRAFVQCLGGPGELGRLDHIELPGDRSIYLGWAAGDEEFLNL